MPAWSDDDDVRLPERRAKSFVDAPDWARPPAAKRRRGADSDLLAGEFDSSEDDGSEASTFSYSSEAVPADTDAALEVTVLQSTDLLTSAELGLPSGRLDVSMLSDVTQHAPHTAAILDLDFHVTSKLIATTGLDAVHLFQVDGTANPKLQTFRFRGEQRKSATGFRPRASKFTPDGRTLIVAGRAGTYFSIDLASPTEAVQEIQGVTHNHGRLRSHEKFAISPDGAMIAFIGGQGYFYLVALPSHSLVATVKTEAAVKDLSFSPDGRHVVAAGVNGRITIYDVRALGSRASAPLGGGPRARPLTAFGDEGALVTKCVSFSPDGDYIAAGASSGVVNVYKTVDALKATAEAPPKPVHAILNMVQEASGVAWHPTGECLSMWSSEAKDVFKVAHTATGTVFQNWPTSGTPLHYVSAAQFSPDGRMLAVGNGKGLVRLFQLNHYVD
jgi:U3 small nucleolar RNA-associated protein 18